MISSLSSSSSAKGKRERERERESERARERERERASCPRICASSSVVRPREREATETAEARRRVRDRAIVHCVAQVNTISNLLYQRFQSFISRALSSPSPLIRAVFNESSLCIYACYGHQQLRVFSNTEFSTEFSISSIYHQAHSL